MPSVLHICTDFWPSKGGIQQFVLDLARRSADIGIQASVLCFNRTKGVVGILPSQATIDGISISRIPFVDLKYYQPVIVPMKLLRRHDLIHVHGIGAPLDYVALAKGVHRRPIVVSTHGGIFHTEKLPNIKRIYFHGFLRCLIRRVDVVAACSRSDAALFSAISKKVELLENAVSVRPYLALPMEKKQRGACLFVGRLAQNKGIERLLHAVSIAILSGSVCSLRLVGPDAEGNQVRFKTLAQQLGIAERVTFVGAVEQEELLREYERAEIFVSASRYEGFGLSAIEAKAAGCRLLLQDNGAFNALFQGDAVATLVDFADETAAAGALSTLLREGSQSGAAERRGEAEAYSWERKILEWSRLYRTLINRAA